MFGSRLRSWMENHIGRPRKRNNKNKQANGSHDVTANKKDTAHLMTNGYSMTDRPTPPTATTTATPHSNGTTNHCCSNGAVSSPVRRREVSPIQNHSRYGWQSPDSEAITSPKSDNYLYAPKLLVKHEAFHQNPHPHPQSQPQTHPHPRQNHHDSKKDPHHPIANDHIKGTLPSQIIQSQLLPENSSSSFSSLSWSTGSKEQSAISIERQKISIERTKRQLQVPIITYQATSNDHPNQLDDEVDAVHYEEIPTTILRNPECHTNRNFAFIQERPKSEQLTTFSSLHQQQQNDHYLDRRSMDDTNSVRYGKLLPSRMQFKYPGSSESIATGGSAECLPQHKTIGNTVSTGLTSGSQHYRLRNSGRVCSTGSKPAASASGSGNSANGTIPLHSLSSPESAYSTGYSTDGTSPGTCFTSNQAPEYYINMRSGTHYFQKSINSLAIETQRCKFGLNKIEEMSPIDPLPKTSFAAACNKALKSNLYPCNGSPYRSSQSHGGDLRNAALITSSQGYESSSPRQRCRIRTNPWVSTHDSIPPPLGTSSTSTPQQSSNTPSSRTSTGAGAAVVTPNYVCFSTNGGGPGGGENGGVGGPESSQKQLNDNKRKGLMERTNNSPFEVHKENGRATVYDSSSSLDTEDTTAQQCTMSLTEVDVSGCPGGSTASSLMLAKRPCGMRESSSAAAAAAVVMMQPLPVACFDASEEDATLNEMMGKFDESYVYEKETDILSDSDATNCPSDLDTGDAGDDAEDECETDELLDIDFIDTASVQEVSENFHQQEHRRAERGTPTPTATPPPQLQPPPPPQIVRHSFRNSYEMPPPEPSKDLSKHRRANSSGRRRKRLVKTRKKSTGEHKENIGIVGNGNESPLRKSRETRSVGGTPISVRRNARESRERNCKTSVLSERASSLVFPHDQAQRRRYMTVAESNKALLKADLEADFKYRQLIQEAESIIVSLKTSAQSLPRETPVSSPRRINPLMNKRVEMLKSNEIKQQQPQQPSPQASRSTDMEHDFSAVLNKRIERLKYESTSAPNSPRSAPRVSPRKTHLTNFISQIDGQRKVSMPPSNEHHHHLTTPTQQQQQQQQQSQSRSPSKVSPLKRKSSFRGKETWNFYGEPETVDHTTNNKMDVANHNYLPDGGGPSMRTSTSTSRKNLYEDYTNHNTTIGATEPIISMNAINYCPQSEPLKRKVYKGSKNFDRIKCGFDFERERIQAHQHQHQHNQGPWHAQRTTTNISQLSNQDINLNSPLMVNRKQLLVDTLSELKQNLENQSVQLNELNVD